MKCYNRQVKQYLHCLINHLLNNIILFFIHCLRQDIIKLDHLAAGLNYSVFDKQKNILYHINSKCTQTSLQRAV